jgi:Carboxypeptidase regulatory-like domain/TonB dependent receptor
MKNKVLVLLMAMFGFSVVASAQTDTGRLVGTVTDATGAVIDGATITVINQGTARSITAETNATGAYVVNALPAGSYHVEIKKQDFKTSSADFTLDVSQVKEINLKLEPGNVSVTVDVTSGVPLVDTSTSSTGEVIQGRQVTELPLNGRNFTQLALLTPGVTRGAYGDEASGGTSGTSSETFRNSDTGGASLSANGLRPQADNFILDGVDNNDGLVNTIVFFPPAEAIQEFRVNTSVAPAEFGRGGGAIVQTTLKSGTNQLHGTGFFFRRSGEFDAHSYQATGPIIYRKGQFGGTLGGAIWKNKLFAFGDYQGLRQDQPNGIEYASVPTDKMRAGNFSELIGLTTPTVPFCAYSGPLSNPAYFNGFDKNGNPISKGFIFDPVAQGSVPACAPFGWNGTTATNIIPNGNPVGLKYLQGYPEPNFTSASANFQQNFQANRQQLRNYDDFDVRVDLNATQKDQIYFRYSYGQDNFTVTNRLGPNNPSGFGSGNNINHPRGIAAGYTRSFTNTLLNEFRFGYISTVYGYNPPNIGQKLGAAIGIPGANPTGLLGGQALIGGSNSELEYQGDGGPYNVPQKFFQFADSLSYIRGRHVFKYGATIGKRNLDFVQGNDAKGYFVIGGLDFPGTGRFTGYEMSELLAGFTDYQIGEFNGLYQTRNWETGYFAQDDWRVTNRLTLNLGLRYDYYTWPYEVNNRQSNWLPTNSADPADGMLITPGSSGAAGLPRSLVNNDKNNWAPRIGFAYDLRGDGKTILRGGYGIFYFLDRGGVGNQLSNNPDFNGLSSYQACPTSDKTCSVEFPTDASGNPLYSRITLSGQINTTSNPNSNDWTQATNPLPPSVNKVNAADPKNVSVIYWPTNSKNSRVQQWNVQLERQLGASMALDVAYVGTKMSDLATSFNANENPLCFSGPPCSAARWSGLGGNVSEYAFIGSGNYNGLQTSLKRRLSMGLTFTAAYTWSHTIDNSNGAFSTTGGGGRIFVDNNGNPLLNLNRGNADQDIRHSFVFASMYEIPFGKGRQFGSSLAKGLDYVVGGWQWNNIVTLQTGTPYDLDVNGSNPGNRPDVTGPISVKMDHAAAKSYITGNFTAPPADPTTGDFLRPGTLGRNFLYGPGYHSWDTGMMKDVKVKERLTLEVRADVFNLLNHPQFQNGSFNTNINNGTIANGITTITANLSTRFSSERQMQFAFRFMF